MSQLVIKVDSLSKKYQLGMVGYGSLQRDLTSLWHRLRGKEDPNSRIGEGSRFDRKGEFWALKDVSFEVREGDRVGILGRNGAGKSTLLKILSQVTTPTGGRFRIRGRVASLLEVGTGFHPELSGRDNVFLNGAIMGMRRAEIRRKFDEIVEFSGVAAFIDTPVKRYSSGMKVKLAFAVAAHLESEILIADEVLAVGDAEFQRKSLAKMEDVSRNQGRTVLFVSHQLGSVRSLCTSGLVLDAGFVAQHGNLDESIMTYLAKSEFRSATPGKVLFDPLAAGQTGFIEISQLVDGDPSTGVMDLRSELQFELTYQLGTRAAGIHVVFTCQQDGELLFTSIDSTDQEQLHQFREPGIYRTRLRIPGSFFRSGHHSFGFRLGIWGAPDLAAVDQILGMEVVLESLGSRFYPESRPQLGRVSSPVIWEG